MVSLVSILAYSCIIGFAAMIHGAIGIGFPLVATPLLAMVTDVKTAILLLVIPTVVINVANIIKGGPWHRSIGLYWPLAVWGMAGSYLGTQVLMAVSPDLFRPLLAVILILYLNAERLGIDFPLIHRHPHFATAVFGLAAGFLGGTVNVMLPALIIYALEVKMPKDVMIQVFNFCFLFGKLTQGMVFIQSGLISVEILKVSIPLALLALAVMAGGMHLRDRIQAATYRLWLRRLLLVMAGVLLIQFILP